MNMAEINLTSTEMLVPLSPELTKLWQVRNGLQLLYGNEDLKDYENLIRRLVKQVDELLEEI